MTSATLSASAFELLLGKILGVLSVPQRPPAVAGFILFDSTTFSSRSPSTLPGVKTFEATGLGLRRMIMIAKEKQVSISLGHQRRPDLAIVRPYQFKVDV
jgi:hypothetical protein